MVRRRASIAAGLALSLAAACGGGGSGSDSPAATVERYAVGGTVTGLTGAGLVLQDNGADDLVVNGDGPFHFPTPVDDGAPYAVTVKTHPAGQACSVSGGSGTVHGAAVTTVTVTCVASTGYRVGGTVTGLSGPGLVLRNNGGDDLPLDADGAFTFATPLAQGATYAVTVGTQPPGRHCTVGNGGGTVTANVDTVTVSCEPLAFPVGGSVSGLSGPGLVLRNNGADDLAVDADGAFTFATALAAGAPYAVTVRTAPAGLRCTVSGGAGIVPAAAVTTVTVTCAPATYAIGGTVSGLTGAGLVLQDNGGDDLAVDADGAFTFATALAAGAPYAVTVRTQPSGQLCAVTFGAGDVAGADVTSVSVACAAAAFRVGGRVSGLTAAGLVLANGGDTLAVDADGVFTFATPIPNGGTYAVTVSAQPSGRRCSVSAGGGAIAGADVDTVRVTCASLGSFVVSGTVTGLPGPGLVLRDNGGDDLAIDADGVFTFATPVADGAQYAVTVGAHPARTRCAVANGAGTVSGADVTGVVVTCHAWTVPAPVRTGGGSASSPVLAFDPSGDALAAWIDVDLATSAAHVVAARYAGATGTWSAPVQLDAGSGGASAPDLAIDPYFGEAVAVWTQEDAGGIAHVWATRLASGSWGAAQRLDTSAFPVTGAARVAVDLLGNALVIWAQRDAGSFANVWSARYATPVLGGTGWGAPGRVDTSELGDAAAPRVACNTSAICYAAWQQSDGTRSSIWGARWTQSARWIGINAPALLEADDTGPAVAPELAVDEAGNAFVSWHQPEPGNAALLRAWAAQYGASAGWGAPVRLEAGAASMRFAEVAADAVGHPGGPNAFAVWRELGAPAVHAARYDRAGAAWGAPASIGGGVADPGAKLLTLRADAAGNALALWFDGARVRANHYTAGVGWDGELHVDAAGEAAEPVVRLDGAGNGLALWIQQAGGGAWQLMSARFR